MGAARAILLCAALVLCACSKATVRPGTLAPGFSREALRASGLAVVPSPGARVEEFRKPVRDLFGTSDSLAAFVAARIRDSLSRGIPAIPILRAARENPGPGGESPGVSGAGAPAENPPYLLRILDLRVGREVNETPVAMLPSGAPGGRAPAGGGTSERCVVTLDVEIVETAAGNPVHAFAVTGEADVVLYAYKTALLAAIRAAAGAAARHVRSL